MNPFIKAIIDNPTDDFPRLVYADWLEERSERLWHARLIRLQCQWAIQDRSPITGDAEADCGFRGMNQGVMDCMGSTIGHKRIICGFHKVVCEIGEIIQNYAGETFSLDGWKCQSYWEVGWKIVGLFERLKNKRENLRNRLNMTILRGFPCIASTDAASWKRGGDSVCSELPIDSVNIRWYDSTAMPWIKRNSRGGLFPYSDKVNEKALAWAKRKAARRFERAMA